MSSNKSQPDAKKPDVAKRDVTEPRLQPGAKWICGHSSLGFSCTTGPTASGRCGNHLHACKGDAMDAEKDSPCASCTLACHTRDPKSDANSPWGECEAVAAAPCVPIRSAWSFRSNLAINLALACTGVLLCLMAFPQREATFVPGSLSAKHAQILENQLVSERCSLCHPNSHTKSRVEGQLATQDELCARCHEGHLPNLMHRSPHDLDRNLLKQLTLNATGTRQHFISFDPTGNVKERHSGSNDTASSRASDSVGGLDNRETTCASCHVEHHGRSANLQAITDQRCQACHAKQFASFIDGHPDFNDYPVSKPRKIAFSHGAHQDKHFAKKNESFDCSKCHVDNQQRGGVGSVFRTLGFDVACARCHDDAINASTIDGWVMIQLPSVQANDVSAVDSKIRDWPATAQFGYEGQVSVVLRALLTADTKLAGALDKLGDSGDLKQIAESDRASVATEFAVATRALIHEVAATGQAAWKERLSKAITHSLARELTVNEHRLIDELCAGLPPDIFRQMEQSWFGAATNVAGITAEPSALSLVSLQQDQDLLSLGEPNGGTKQAASEDDLLLGNNLGSKQEKPNDKAKNQLKREKLTKLRGAVNVASGGWYLDQETLSLRYMPRGHADLTLAAWNELATILSTGSSDQLAKQIPGSCTQCHVLGSAHSSEPHAPHSEWLAYSKPPMDRALTKFDHTPHLTLPTVSDCRYCHQLKQSGTTTRQNTSPRSSDVQLTSLNADPSEGNAHGRVTECEFKSMSIDQCTACHRPNAASITCTQCHNYHVTTPHGVSHPSLIK